MTDSHQTLDILLCLICLTKATNAHMCPHCSKLCCFSCFKDWLTLKRCQCPNCRTPLRLDGLVNCSKIANRFHEQFQKRLDIDNQNNTCLKHFMVQQYFCQDCNLEVCSDCVMFQQEHRQHKVTKLSKVLDHYRSLIKDPLSRLEEYEIQLQQAIQKLQRQRKEKLKVAGSSLKAVSQTSVVLRDRLNKRHSAMSTYLESCQSDLQNQIEALSQIVLEYDCNHKQLSYMTFLNRADSIILCLDKFNKKFQVQIQQSPVIEDPFRPLPDVQEFRVPGFKKSRELNHVMYTEVFNQGGLQWRLKIYPCSNSSQQNNYLSIFVQLVKALVPTNQYQYRIELINQVDPSISILKQYQKQFSERQSWGYTKFAEVDSLFEEGYILKDKDQLHLRLTIGCTNYYHLTLDNQSRVQQLQEQVQILTSRSEHRIKEEPSQELRVSVRKI